MVVAVFGSYQLAIGRPADSLAGVIGDVNIFSDYIHPALAQ